MPAVSAGVKCEGKYEGAIVLDLSFVNITFWRILFRSDGYTYLDLASSSCDMVAFDRRFVGVWENYTRTPFWLSHVFYLKKRQPYPPPPHQYWEEKSRSRRLHPRVYPLHKFSLVVVFYIAIKGALSQPLFRIYHYSGSTITSGSSSFFSFFSLFWIDESFPRGENQVTRNTEARFIGSWVLIYVVECQTTSYRVLKILYLLSQYWHFHKR